MDIEILRTICLPWPAVTEDVKWENNLCFSVGGKMFCMAALDDPYRVSFKVSDEVFDELSTANGFMPAPYMARAKWVTVTDLSRINRAEWEQYLRKSYDLVVARIPKKTRLELGLG